ncbi:MAG: DUF308 domain-containing protein [Butyrivibrio sp.]|nr:DUF308 domain-containing protein [Butyrivibrio sp.]
METIKKMRKDQLIQALVVIAIGVVLLFWAPAIIPLMAKILAALLFLIGVVFAAAYFFKKEKRAFDSGMLVAGILIAAVGTWIFINPGTFTDFIPRIFGVFIILSGLRNLTQTLSLVRAGDTLWWIALILALVTLGLGGFLVFKATEAKELIVRIIGGFLAYDGISNIWTIARVARFQNKVVQIYKDASAVDVDAEIVDVNSSDSAQR